MRPAQGPAALQTRQLIVAPIKNLRRVAGGVSRDSVAVVAEVGARRGRVVHRLMLTSGRGLREGRTGDQGDQGESSNEGLHDTISILRTIVRGPAIAGRPTASALQMSMRYARLDHRIIIFMDELINQTEGSLYLGLGLEAGRSANLAASFELKREHLAVQGNALEVARLGPPT